MSNIVSAIAQQKLVGSPTRKSVLMYIADKASDDGSGIWVSKANIAADLELSKRAVQIAMQSFMAIDLVKEVGKRPTNNGFTYVYDIDLDVLNGLHSTREPDSPVNLIHPTGESHSPQDVNLIHPNHPLTILEPSNARESLFNEIDSDQIEPDLGEKYFNEFWNDIWPNHKRKTGKVDCRQVYLSALSGKHPKADKITGPELNAATQAYIGSVKDREFLKGPLPWLRSPGWEPFLGESGLSENQLRMRRMAQRSGVSL